MNLDFSFKNVIIIMVVSVALSMILDKFRK